MATPSQLSDKLRLVASKGEKGKIKGLLQEGAKFDIDKYGRTALHYAAYYGQAETAKACIQLGCEINIQDVYGSTALHRAVIDGHVDVVQALIEDGIAIDRQDENGNTALHEAAWNGYSRTVDMLLKFGKCNIHAANKHGLRAIHLSCQNGHNQTTRNLLRGGTHPSIKDLHGDTPLHIATRFGHVACTRIMVSAQADINAQNKDGNTALHMAAGLGKQKITRFLADSGCDVNIRNNNNLTAIDLARKNEHPDVILIIMSAPKRKYQEKEKAKRKGKHSKSAGAIGGESPVLQIKKEVRFKHHRNKSEGDENPSSPGKKRKELKNVDQIDSILVTSKDKAIKKKSKDKKREEQKLLQETGFAKHELKKRVKEQKKLQEEIMMTQVMNQPGPSQHIFYADKQKPVKSSVGCNCTPQLLQIQNKVDANREVMIHEIEHSHNKLDRKIGNLEKKMEHQGECLDKLCQERIHAEHKECLHRLDHRAMIERADWEESHVDRMGNVKKELKEWVAHKLKTGDLPKHNESPPFFKADDSGYVQNRSNMNSFIDQEGMLSPFQQGHNQHRTVVANSQHFRSDKSNEISSPERSRNHKTATNQTLIVEDVSPTDRSDKNVTRNEPNHKNYVHIGINDKSGACNPDRTQFQSSGDNMTSLYVHTGAVPKTRSNSFTKAVLKQEKMDRIKNNRQTVEIEVHKEFIDGEKPDKLVTGNRTGFATPPNASQGSQVSNRNMSSQNLYQRSRSLSPKREPDLNNQVVVNSRNNLDVNQDENTRSRSMSPAYQKVQATSRDRKSRQAARKSDMIMNGPEQVMLRAKSASPSRKLMVNGISPDSGLESNKHQSLTEDDQMSMSSGIGSAGQSSPQQNITSIPNGHSTVSPKLLIDTKGNAPLYCKKSDILTHNYANRRQSEKLQNNVGSRQGNTTKRVYIDTSQYDLYGKTQINSINAAELSTEAHSVNPGVNDSHVLKDKLHKTLNDQPHKVLTSTHPILVNSTDIYRCGQSPNNKYSNYSHSKSVPPESSNVPSHVTNIDRKTTIPEVPSTFHPRVVNTSGQPLVVASMNGRTYTSKALPMQQAPPRNAPDLENSHMTKSQSFQVDNDRSKFPPPYHATINSRNTGKPAQYSSQPDLHSKRQECRTIPEFAVTSNMQHSQPSRNSLRCQLPEQQVTRDHQITSSTDKLSYEHHNNQQQHSPQLSVSSSSTTMSGGSGNRRQNPLDVSLMKEFLSKESKPDSSGIPVRAGETNLLKIDSTANTLSNSSVSDKKLTSNFGSSTTHKFSTFGY